MSRRSGRGRRRTPLTARLAQLAPFGAGLLLAAGLPPWGWWPLSILGVALFTRLLDHRDWWGRGGLAFGTSAGFLFPGMAWAFEFTLPGYLAAVAIVVVITGSALVLVPPTGWPTWVGVPAALALAEWTRSVVPFGGVPIATPAQTQIGGPLDQVARIGGPLLLAALVGIAGVAVARLVARSWLPAAAGAAVVVGVVALAAVAPRGQAIATMDVALVQGGGEQGTQADPESAALVYARHIDRSTDVPVGLDLVLWPENAVNVDAEDVADTPEGQDLSELARLLETTLVVGVTADVGSDGFRNEAVAWGPDGTIVDRYEKQQRVPFGEYIPLRPLVSSLADVSAVPRDAVAGTDPPILETDAGTLGVAISYETFFARITRSAVDHGGELLLVPTNAASYSTGQMPALELGASRLRAIETGRDTLQTAPTGYSAVIDDDGRVLQRTSLTEGAVLTATVERRTGATLYVRLGDLPFLAAAGVALVVGWASTKRRPIRQTGRS